MDPPLHIGIVHANVDVRSTLHAAISQMGHTVCCHASTGRELIKVSQSRRPDLCIVQEYLPDMTGMHAVQQTAGELAIPSIVVIDRHNGQLLNDSDSTNVMGVLAQPIRASDLIPLLPLALRRFEQLQLLRESIQQLKNEVGGEW